MTVRELIERLEKFEPSREVIIDEDGNTWMCKEPEIWDENDSKSPIAFYLR